MTTASLQALPRQTSTSLGSFLVFAAAITWSLGGLLARLAEVDNPWVTIFWRTATASLFLLFFMLARDGLKGTIRQFDAMGWPGLAVGFCFATASTAFVVALSYTSVANILLMQAGVPLIAALISYILFRESIRFSTWFAIAAVIGGVGIMVSDSLTGKISPIGDTLSLLIAIAFATATVITRRYSDLRMTPAVFVGSAMGWLVAVAMTAKTTAWLAVSLPQLGILVVFGLSLGLGMMLFTFGARAIPSALAALLGVAETIAGPVWVWIFLNEVPNSRTLLGGSIVMAALVAYLSWQIYDNYKIRRIVPPVN